MEDYDVINEMHNIKEKVVMFVEEDEKIYKLLVNDCECMPIRFSYDVSNFSEEYINDTKELFTFYYNNENTFENELLKLKKHFKHYKRYPFIIYINKDNKNYLNIKKMCDILKIECVTNKKIFIKKATNDKKIFLIDSDDTLRDSVGNISSKNKKGIKKIISNGDYAIICTARPRYHTLNIMNQSKASKFIISSNGAELYDANKDRTIKSCFIDKKDVYKIIEVCFKYDVRLVLSLDDCDYVTKIIRNRNQYILDRNKYKNQLNGKKIKTCMIIDEKKDAVKSVREKLVENKNLTIINEKNDNDDYYEEWFTVGNGNANKGSAAISMSDYLMVPLKNVITIGNDYNDLPMFKISGISITLENAPDNLKKMTTYTVSSNDKDGVYEGIMKVYDLDN